jgi:hypothetical protein
VAHERIEDFKSVIQEMEKDEDAVIIPWEIVLLHLDDMAPHMSSSSSHRDDETSLRTAIESIVDVMRQVVQLINAVIMRMVKFRKVDMTSTIFPLLNLDLFQFHDNKLDRAVQIHATLNSHLPSFAYYSCSNPCCMNLDGTADAKLKTFAQNGTPRRFCSRACQIEVWKKSQQE